MLMEILVLSCGGLGLCGVLAWAMDRAAGVLFEGADGCGDALVAEESAAA